MSKQKKEQKGKPVTFILSSENQELLKEYEKRLPPGACIMPSQLYNSAINYYLTCNMPSNQE